MIFPGGRTWEFDALWVDYFGPLLHGTDATPEPGMALAKVEFFDDLLARASSSILYAEVLPGAFTLWKSRIENPIAIDVGEPIYT